MFNLQQTEYIQDLFLGYLKKYPKGGGESMGWEGDGEQLARFDVFWQHLLSQSNSTVCDIGCGEGDFFGYLVDRQGHPPSGYLGMDMVKDSIALASARYPTGNFLHGTHELMLGQRFDYAIASGIFAVNIDNAEETYFGIIRDIFSICNRAFAFNMLTKEFNLRDAPEIIQFDPETVRKKCLHLSDHVEIIKGYLPIDFTVIIYRD